jgi:hypothetical protein
MLYERHFEDGKFRFELVPEGRKVVVRVIYLLNNNEIVKEYISEDEESGFAIFDALHEIYNDGLGEWKVYDFKLARDMGIENSRYVTVIKE